MCWPRSWCKIERLLSPRRTAPLVFRRSATRSSNAFVHRGLPWLRCCWPFNSWSLPRRLASGRRQFLRHPSLQLRACRGRPASENDVIINGEGRPTVTIPRIEAKIEVDGRLDEPPGRGRAPRRLLAVPAGRQPAGRGADRGARLVFARRAPLRHHRPRPRSRARSAPPSPTATTSTRRHGHDLPRHVQRPAPRVLLHREPARRPAGRRPDARARAAPATSWASTRATTTPTTSSTRRGGSPTRATSSRCGSRSRACATRATARSGGASTCSARCSAPATRTRGPTCGAPARASSARPAPSTASTT